MELFEIFKMLVIAYFVCWIISAFVPSSNQASRTAGNIKGLADDSLESFNESIEEARAKMKAEREAASKKAK